MLIFRGRIAKKIESRNSASQCRSFHGYCFSFANVLAAKFDLNPCRRSFPSLSALASEVAVRLNLNLSWLPFLGKDVDLDLLLCTGFGTCGFVPRTYFYPQPINDRKNEPSDKHYFGLKHVLAKSMKCHFHMKKNSGRGQIILTLKPSQLCKSGCTSAYSNPVARSVCWQLGNALSLRLPVRPAKTVQPESKGLRSPLHELRIICSKLARFSLEQGEHLICLHEASRLSDWSINVVEWARQHSAIVVWKWKAYHDTAKSTLLPQGAPSAPCLWFEHLLIE